MANAAPKPTPRALAFERLTAGHLERLAADGRFAEAGGGAYFEALRDPQRITVLTGAGTAYAAVLGDVDVLGAAGLWPKWPGHMQAWAIFADVPRRCWPAMTRFAARGMEQAEATGGVRRIECHVRCDFAPARRWLGRLGFVVEAVCEAWGPDGADHIQMARLK